MTTCSRCGEHFPMDYVPGHDCDPSRDFDAESRDLPGRPYAHSFDYIMHGYMMEVFKPHLRGSRALELGCYRGEFTKRIVKHFLEVTIVDGSMGCLLDASTAVRKMSGTRYELLSSFENATLPDQHYDAVFLIHTLEHVDDPVFVLKRIKNWLKPGGRLFLAVPNAHAASRQIAEKMGLISDCYAVTEGEKTHGHRRTYSLGTLEDDVLAAGLNVVERGGIMFKPMANFQLDSALQKDIIDRRYLDGCFELGKIYPEMCASVYAVCER